ncbi:MAG: ABC transporter permease [Lachnospiraceae bacterium]|nr:ABC transporter permease [Lachnospiraceae bacterium]
MKISSIGYGIKQGWKNLRKNRWYSLASVLTMAACIFLFGISYALVANVEYMVKRAETTIGVTVFFDDGISRAEIDTIGELLKNRAETASVRFVSAEEAWESMKKDYFADMPELAEGFAQDNPLINSSSYEVFLKRVEDQPAFVEYVKSLPGVRRVNYSELTASGLGMLNRVITGVSAVLIGILLVVSVFLISNTIALAINIRREEIRIMRFIGATGRFVRMPFVIEGILIGCMGAALPLLITYLVYGRAVLFFTKEMAIFSSLFVLLPVGEVFRVLIPAASVLGIGIGFVGSEISVRRHLHV